MIFGRKKTTIQGAVDPQERIRQLNRQIAGAKNDFQKQFLLQDLKAELKKQGVYKKC